MHLAPKHTLEEAQELVDERHPSCFRVLSADVKALSHEVMIGESHDR